jgi:aminoglycoside/choline kinase family phosphotransferase
VATPPASDDATFLHRDFHPANTLWRAGRLCGIVDWEGAAWGPPASDLAHLRANVGVGHDPEVADRVSRLYVEAGGEAPDGSWWDVRTLLDWLPELGDRLGTGEGLERVERYLSSVLGAKTSA